MIIDPGVCAKKIVDIHGEAGRAWLERLPTTLAHCAREWSLEVLPPFAELSYNYVTPAITADGTPVVIKAGVPSQELAREAEALGVFDGHGVVQLLDADMGLGVMLLERVEPGASLADVDDDETVTQAAVSVMRQLWTPAPAGHGLASVSGWAAGLGALRAHFCGGYGPFPQDLVETVERLYAELLDPQGERTLIHGDLHPQNILSARRMPWLAIDPKGVVGDPMWDVATFVCSISRLLAASDQRRTLARRLDQVAGELDLDRQLVAKWGLAHCVLSGWWSYEDHGGGWEWAFERARLLESLQKR